MEEKKDEQEKVPFYTAVRCDCGWPIFRIHKNGVALKHHSCDVVNFFPWAMIDTWKAQGSALQGR
jgi:hypothetical protein